jgi:hypothetical protein
MSATERWVGGGLVCQIDGGRILDAMGTQGAAPSGGHHWGLIVAIIGVVVAVPGALVALITLNSGSKASSSSSTVASSTVRTSGQASAVSSTQAATPAGPVYLWKLTPSAGDVPMRGDTQADGRDFPNSIFYGDIGVGKPSQAQACQGAPNEDCVATQYDISNEPNRQFSAVLAVTNSSPSSNENATAPWSITVDGAVAKSGTFESNSPPQQITVPLNGGHVLQLFINPTDPGLSETVNVVWGDAKLS